MGVFFRLSGVFLCFFLGVFFLCFFWVCFCAFWVFFCFSRASAIFLAGFELNAPRCHWAECMGGVPLALIWRGGPPLFFRRACAAQRRAAGENLALSCAYVAILHWELRGGPVLEAPYQRAF